MSINTTYSPTGPTTAGPSTGPADGSSCAVGKNQLVDGLAVDDGIMGLLKAAGTLERYGADYSEYNRKYAAWKEKAREVGSAGYYNAGPKPIPPNPYDYL